MLQLLRLILAGPKPLSCKIYPPGVPVDPAESERGRVVIVIELPG